MRVLMFGWEFPPHITGGLGTACFGMVKGLVKNDAEVIFVVPKAFGDESQEGFRLLSASDVVMDLPESFDPGDWSRISYIEIGSNIIPYASSEDFEYLVEKETAGEGKEISPVFAKRYEFSGKYGQNLMEEVSRYALVASVLARSQQFDVIHAHDWLTYPAGIAAKTISGKPLVVHVHATEFDRSGEHVNQPVYDLERYGMEMADRVITVSNFTRQIVIDRYGIPAGKVITVHNAVEPVDKTGAQPVKKHVKEKIVTFLGRVTFQKGPDYFIESAHQVIRKYPDVRFVMAGSGDLLNRMIRRVARLRIATNFHFTGFLKGDDVDTMFAMSDVYVMPSVSEPFGISPLEALRANVPIVISKQSGVSEVLDHAIKVDFWDVDALADAIYGILKYESIPRMFERYGQMELNRLKWEKSAKEILEVYGKAIGDRVAK